MKTCIDNSTWRWRRSNRYLCNKRFCIITNDTNSMCTTQASVIKSIEMKELLQKKKMYLFHLLVTTLLNFPKDTSYSCLCMKQKLWKNIVNKNSFRSLLLSGNQNNEPSFQNPIFILFGLIWLGNLLDNWLEMTEII